MERVFRLYPDRDAARRDASAQSVGDDEIRRTIADGRRRFGQTWCPHTATAVCVRERIDAPHFVIAATAHPAKFDTIVEPLVGGPVDPPPALGALLSRPTRVTEIEADFAELARALDQS
jgi:threonine synthase